MTTILQNFLDEHGIDRKTGEKINNDETPAHPSKQQWENEHPGIGWRHQCDICKNSYNYGICCDKNLLFNVQWRFLDFIQDDIPFFTCGFFDCDKEKEVQLLEKIKEAKIMHEKQ